MKKYIILLFLLNLPLLCKCQEANFDKRKLRTYAEKLEIRYLDLGKNFSKEFENFLIKTNEVDLRNSLDYEYSVTLVLLKLYHFQLKTTKQGYNLFDEKSESAKIIVKNFCKISGINSDREFLNSVKVFEFIHKNKKIMNMPEIKSLIKKIDFLEKIR